MDIYPKKSLGQHFLNSPHTLGQIVSAAHIGKDEAVLEIGPGTGILTKALLDAGARVVAVEKDDRAHDFLKGIFSRECEDGRLILINGDILDNAIFATLPAPFSLLPASYSLVANIPYYITGAILEKFLEHQPRPRRMTLLVQKEVAERIVVSGSGNGEEKGKESILSISVKAFGTPRIVARVPRGAFAPAPKVDSAILQISDISDDRFTEKNIPIRRFFEIVRAGFAHKRKLLKRNLESVTDVASLEGAWRQIGLNEKVRAEDVSLDQWFELCAGLSP